MRRDFVLCEPGTENILSDKLNFIMLQLYHFHQKKEKTLEIARTMKARGIALDLISECTGLQIMEIERL